MSWQIVKDDGGRRFYWTGVIDGHGPRVTQWKAGGWHFKHKADAYAVATERVVFWEWKVIERKR